MIKKRIEFRNALVCFQLVFQVKQPTLSGEPFSNDWLFAWSKFSSVGNLGIILRTPHGVFQWYNLFFQPPVYPDPNGMAMEHRTPRRILYIKGGSAYPIVLQTDQYLAA